MNEAVAVSGCGLIGRAWTIVFARAGCDVRFWDANPAVLGAAHGLLETAFLSAGEDPAILARASIHPTLAEAVRGTVWVQENVPEKRDIKQAIYADHGSAGRQQRPGRGIHPVFRRQAGSCPARPRSRGRPVASARSQSGHAREFPHDP